MFRFAGRAGEGDLPVVARRRDALNGSTVLWKVESGHALP